MTEEILPQNRFHTLSLFHFAVGHNKVSVSGFLSAGICKEEKTCLFKEHKKQYEADHKGIVVYNVGSIDLCDCITIY